METRRNTIFKKDFHKLSNELQQRANKQIFVLVENSQHPSLRLKKVKSERGVWEVRISKSHRFTFQRVDGGIILLRRIGKHDEVLKNP